MKPFETIKNHLSQFEKAGTCPYEAYDLAVTLGRRIPSLEALIMTKPYSAVRYAIFVIKGRWIEAEPNIKGDFGAYQNYCHYFPECNPNTQYRIVKLEEEDVVLLPSVMSEKEVLHIIQSIDPEVEVFKIISSFPQGLEGPQETQEVQLKRDV